MTDSWGRTTTEKINLNVTVPIGIEQNSLNLFVNNESLLKMSVDSLEMRLAFDVNRRLYRQGNPSDAAFILTMYDPFWNKITEFFIMNEQTITQEMIDRITERNIVYGMKIHIYAAEMDQVRIVGPMTSQNMTVLNDFSNGFETADLMMNTYFELTKEGIVEIYNEPPQISGLNEIEVLVGSTDTDWLAGIELSDDLDSVSGDYEYDVFYDISTVDVQTVGEYALNYTVTDKLGRATTQPRKVFVVPKLRENKVMLVNNEEVPYFTIGFDKYGESFEVTINQEIKTGEKLDNLATFEFSVYSPANELIKKMTIESFDDLNSLQELENVTYQANYQFAIETNVAQQVKVMNELIKDPLITEDSYEDGVDNPDFIDNVRFINNQKQLEVVYNQAPTIEIDADVELEFYMGERIDYKEGVIVTDVDSVVNEENIKIFMYDDQGELILDDSLEPKELVEESRDMFSEPGEYTLLYVVTDAWGRTANATRIVTVHHGMLRNIFAFSAINGSKHLPDAAHIGFTVNEAGEIRTQYTRNLMTQDEFGTGDRSIHLLDIRDSEGNSKLGGWFRLAGLTPLGGATAEALDNILLEEGDTIHFSSDQGKSNKIYGEMYNTGNDYSLGIAQTYQTQMAGFTISKYGLIENEIEPEAVAPGENEVWIDFYGIYDGGIVSRMKIDLNTDPDGDDPLGVLVEVEGAKSTDGFTISGFYQMSSSVLYNSTIFTMKHLTEDGTQKMASSLTGRRGYNIFRYYSTAQAGAAAKLKHGDYYTMVLNTTLLDDAGKNVSEYFINNIRIYGDVIYPENFTDDFADGIDSVEHINYSRLYFTKEGLIVDYNEPPVVNGADDVTLIVGSTFDPLEGVTFTDDLGVSSSEVVSNNVNTSVAGEYQVVYRVTDILNRVTEVKRKVDVRDLIYQNKIDVYPLDMSMPILTFYIDDLANTYEAIVHVEDRLSTQDHNSESFRLRIFDAQQNLKFQKSIRGNETITSNTFSDLKNIVYEDGDYLKIYKDARKEVIETLKISGTIVNQQEDYTDGVQNVDNLYHVSFRASRVNGFESIYNEGPIITGLTDMEFYRDIGATNETLFTYMQDKVSITDDRDGVIDIRSFVIENSPDFSRTGQYDTTFTITDSQDHATSQTVNISILSNLLKNTLNVYGETDEKFEVSFARSNSFDVLNKSNDAIEDDLVINIYNRFSELLTSINLASTDTANNLQLQALNDLRYENQYYIMFESTANNQVRIKGPVVRMFNELGDPVLTPAYEFGTTVEELNKVRFYLTENGLHATKRPTEITIEGLTPISVTRGDETVDLTEGLVIKHPTEMFTPADITIEDFNLYEEGVYEAKYIIVDSWGTRFESIREITVTPRQDVERNVIEVKNPSTAKTVFEVKLDTINLKLRTTKLSEDPFEGTFQFNLYNQYYKLLESFEINDNNIDVALATINQLNFKYGYMFGIASTDVKNGIAIQGMIDNQLEDYSDGVDKLDYIENVRFIINTSYLSSLYNEAPQINGITQIELIAGTSFDPLEGLSVSDDLDEFIDPQDIEVLGVVDTDEIGVYELTYKVSDSFGRVTEVNRIIKVVSRIENVSIDLYSKQNSNDVLMSLTFDSEANQFIAHDSSREEVLDATKLDEIILSIDVYRAQELMQSISLTGAATSSALVAFNTFNFEYGDMIELSLGETIVDTTPLYTKEMIKVSGAIIKDYIITEDYHNGIETADYIENVRFIITETDIVAEHNEAPVLMSTLYEENTTLEKHKDVNFSVYNLLNGFIVSDDKDQLDVKNTIIVHKDTQIEISNESLSDIKQYELEYYILDNWGRRSNSIFMNLNLLPTIDLNTIEFYRIISPNTTLEQPDRLKEKLVDLKLNHIDGAGGSFNLIYNEANDQLTLPLLIDSTEATPMYAIKLIRDDVIIATVNFNTNDTMASKLSEFATNFTTFKYGDQLLLTSVEGPSIALKGKIIDAVEDYSDGIHYATKLHATTFEITKNGLQALNEDSIYSVYDSIQYYVRANGLIGFNIAINTDTLMFEFSNIMPNVADVVSFYDVPMIINDKLDRFDERDSTVYVMNHYASDGTLKGSLEATASDFVNGVNSTYEFFNNRTFEFTDYLMFHVSTLRDHNEYFHLKPGTLYHSSSEDAVIEGVVGHDYSQGIKDQSVETFNTTKFFITETGLSAEMNSPPEIGGEIVILKYGEPFEPLEGMYVSDIDPWDAHLSVNDIVIEDNQFNSEYPGAYEITYSITDSRGAKTYFVRYVLVEGIPLAVYPQGEVVSVELNSVTDNDAYLRTLIEIEDFEDGNLTNQAEITTQFNPNEIGIYDVSYEVSDSNENSNIFKLTVQVVKTINVSVPINNVVPFQIVTNLIDSDDPFISGIITVENHNIYSGVAVLVESFTKGSEVNTLQIVSPMSEDWDNLSVEDSMTKMALGMYPKYNVGEITKENPIWLIPSESPQQYVTTIPQAIDEETSSIERFSFTSLHGPQFRGGTSTGRFDLTLRFE